MEHLSSSDTGVRSALADLPGAISKALASLTERVDQMEGKGTLEARMFGKTRKTEPAALAFLRTAENFHSCLVKGLPVNSAFSHIFAFFLA